MPEPQRAPSQMSKSHRFHTIGHSTRPLEEFAALLNAAGVELLVDVRTVPRSRTNPQFNRDTLPDALSGFGIDYRHFASLGGLRGRKAAVPPHVNAFWQNQSFHNYADYAMSDAFQAGLHELRELGHEKCCAIMCAEAVWWRCHRRIIADYLLASGESVFHIMGDGRIAPAVMTSAARRDPNGVLIYPADQ